MALQALCGPALGSLAGHGFLLSPSGGASAFCFSSTWILLCFSLPHLMTSSFSSSQTELTCCLLRPPSQTNQSKATSTYNHLTPPLSLFLFYFLPLWNVFMCYCCVVSGYGGSSLRAGPLPALLTSVSPAPRSVLGT